MKKHAAVCLGALALLAGCTGYNTRFAVPSHLKTFSVATFRNRTQERNLDYEFTRALVDEIHAKTELRMAPPAQADLMITGQIAEQQRHLPRRKSRGLKDEVRYVLYANVDMLDRREDRPFFTTSRSSRRAEVQLNRGSTRREGREEVIRELARRVVALAFERWPNPHPRPPIVEGESRAQ